MLLAASLPTNRALALTSALQGFDMTIINNLNENDHIVADDVANLKSGQVGQVKAATSLELAELVQLLRHLKVIGWRKFRRKRSSS